MAKIASRAERLRRIAKGYSKTKNAAKVYGAGVKSKLPKKKTRKELSDDDAAKVKDRLEQEKAGGVLRNYGKK